MSVKQSKNWELWLSAIIIFLTVFLMYAYYNRWFSFAERIGPFRIVHYVVFAGTLYIAFGVILFAVLKRRSPLKNKVLLRAHVFGNLISVMLVSIHFAGQVGRPADFYPEFGTGLALYIALVLLTATGLALRFGAIPGLKRTTNRFVHASIAFSFYIVIIVHVLHGLGII